MDRRKVLLIVAALIAALGTAVVFLYVRGADSRANLKFAGKQVLVASSCDQPGRESQGRQELGQDRGKTVTAGSLVPGYVTDLAAIPDENVALTTIYPGEQILRGKFGRRPRVLDDGHPDQAARGLAEPHRPGPCRRVRQPGREGGDLHH
jgi:pilus assembly protein CpaB